jgi:hypothetical protein
MVDRYLGTIDREEDGDADTGPFGPPQHVGPGIAA